MDQHQFIQRHEPTWLALEQWLAARPRQADAALTEQIPAHLRAVAHHLALARARAYSPQLIARLAQLTESLHARFYHGQGNLATKMIDFLLGGLPRAARREWRWLALSAVAFFGSAGAMLVGVLQRPDFVYSILPVAQVEQLEAMYSGPASDPDAGAQTLMFGFYIFNNIGVGFRTFASGLVFGIGSLLMLGFNGLFIGAAAGYLSAVGYGERFWGFVAGHSAMELTAIVFSGAAGLKLGLAIVNPGRLRRPHALRVNARTAMELVYAAMVLFLLAAFIEAFWSPVATSTTTKYVMGLSLWLGLIAYLVFAGRRH